MSKVDKIVSSFTKTVNALMTESNRLDGLSITQTVRANELLVVAEGNKKEASRALSIANNLENILEAR